MDVALSDSLDIAQRHYFEAIVAKQVKPGDKIIIVLHAPDWFKREYKALTMICQLAREQGEVCAILAGDLHHYSRYESDYREPKLQLITAGGGGAFSHPTHDQRKKIRIRDEVAGAGVKSAPRTVKEDRPTVLDLLIPGGKGDTGGRISFSAHQFYPTRGLSRILALQNIFLPLHNRRFALFIGLVYMIYAWVFQIAVADPTVAIRQAQSVNIEMQCLADNPGNEEQARTCSETKIAALTRRLSELTSPEELSKSQDSKVKPSGVAAKEGQTR